MEIINLVNNASNFTDVISICNMNGLYVKEDNDYPSLYMITYLHNDNLTNNLLRQCKGLILEKNTNKIICYSLDKTLDKIEDLSTISRIEESIDGTHIRLFYYNNKWNVATSRCIDAKKAYWLYSNKNFYELFQEAADYYHLNYNNLDKNCCYSFVLGHPENRIVIKYKTPVLYHVLTRNLITLKEEYQDICIRKPDLFDYNLNDILNHSTDRELINEGFMICDINNNRLKVRNVIYQQLKELRGNSYNLFYRFLELKQDNLVTLYLKFFPEMLMSFDVYELNIHNMAMRIHLHYCNKYVNKLNPEIPGYLIKILNILHNYYLTTSQIITKKIVYKELYKLHPKQITYIYNRMFTQNSN